MNISLSILFAVIPRVIFAFTKQAKLWPRAITAAADVRDQFEKGNISSEARRELFAKHIAPLLADLQRPIFWENIVRELAVFYIETQLGGVKPLK